MKGTRSQLTLLAFSVALVAVFGVNAWLLLATEITPAAMVLILAAELFLLLSVIWVAHTFLQLRLFQPMLLLQDQFKLLTHGDADHQFDLPAQHYLGDLPDIAQDLGHALVRERHQTALAIDAATASLDQRRARLEAILHDLTEGVIVCSPEHQIVLFNQAAGVLLKHAGTLSLHRKISSFFTGGLIERKFDDLKALYQSSSERRIIEFDTMQRGADTIRLRMNLIVEPDRLCSGYVITLSSHAKTIDLLSRYQQSVLTDRPEFYDFSLFDRDMTVADSNRSLADLMFVVFDTETTGLRPSKGDEIVQISGVRIINGAVLEREVFDCLVNPGFAIPQSSIRFHGITDDMVVDSPSAAEALRRFHSFADNAVLVAHNAAFDMKFLKMKEVESGVVFDHAVLDTLLLSFVLQPNHSAHTLDAIATRFGVQIPLGARHTALGDARSTAQVFARMLEALPHHGITTLKEAIDASNQVFKIRKLQEQF